MSKKIEFTSRKEEITALEDAFSKLCTQYDLKEKEIHNKWDELED